jgi:Uma2 family endonuclease
MSQTEFADLYRRTPDSVAAELIGGVVYVSPPPSNEHDAAHMWLSAILMTYKMSVVGIEIGSSISLVMDDEFQPQPDLILRRLPEFGGRSITRADGSIQGPPELVVEIAYSRRSIELHTKMAEYARCGVVEYLVYMIDEKRLRWFDLPTEQELFPEESGIFKIRQFPGLWIDQQAITANNRSQMIAVLQSGLAKPAHRSFARKMQAMQPPRQPRKMAFIAQHQC